MKLVTVATLVRAALPNQNKPYSTPEKEATDNSSKNSSLTSEMQEVRNVVIFGDSGVGKSSLINMLGGRKIAQTSSGVLGCTFQSDKYHITIGGESLNVWDTAGLDEGTRGRVSPEAAEKNLTKLLRDLRNANGIHLLVYCIRGSSIRKSLARNYVIFYSAICRKKVPIVAVVTGLENEPVSMDNWWTTGEKELARYKMRFDDHACVTTIDMERFKNSVFAERSVLSQRAVQKLIIEQCHRTAIRPRSDPNISIKAALHDFRSMMKSGWENIGPPSNVILCQADIRPVHTGVFGEVRQTRSQINGRSFVFHHTGDLSESYINPKRFRSGADLLIFAGTMSGPSLETFRQFYESCHGELCPLLIVTEVDSVRGWTNYLDRCRIYGHVRPLPRDGSTELHSLIDELCLVRGAASSSGGRLLKYLRRETKEGVADGPGVLVAIGP